MHVMRTLAYTCKANDPEYHANLRKKWEEGVGRERGRKSASYEVQCVNKPCDKAANPDKIVWLCEWAGVKS